MCVCMQVMYIDILGNIVVIQSTFASVKYKNQSIRKIKHSCRNANIFLRLGPDLFFCIRFVWFRQGSEPVLQGHRPDGRVATRHHCRRLPGAVQKQIALYTLMLSAPWSLKLIGIMLFDTAKCIIMLVNY